ncbi:MAG: ROK family protein [Clostridia bacterium]|nr:ROK family protein [Clostridia bacterium]
MKQKMYIGVDIGGTKTAVVKGDETGRILEKVKFATTGVEETLRRILAEVKRMGEATAIGVSCGGPLDSEKGLILSPPNLPGWDRIPITELLTKETGIPAYLQNDADACALAEWRFGAGKGTRNMIFLTFGTGMGAGLILNGALYGGSCGRAGEVGHIAMESDGPVGYGKAGSFEGFCSGGGIRQCAIKKARTMLAQGQIPSYCSTVAELDTVTAQTVADAARKGHPDALEVYADCGRMLGRGLAILIDLLNPQRIVIGSIFARAEALLRESMEREIAKEALPDAAEICEIVPAALGEAIGDIAAITVAVEGENAAR